MYTFRINTETRQGEILLDGEMVETCPVRDIPSRLVILRAGRTAQAYTAKRGAK